MVPISIKSWPEVPETIKKKLVGRDFGKYKLQFEFTIILAPLNNLFLLQNVFELAPESEYAVMNSASQKWRDFKNKLTSRFVWPNKDNPEKLISPPSQYQLPLADWKAFVDARLDPSWEVL